VPVLQRLSAAVTYGRLRAALSPDAMVEPEPGWLTTLRARLTVTAERLRSALVSRAPPW
jgi:hypothetical protein